MPSAEKTVDPNDKRTMKERLEAGDLYRPTNAADDEIHIDFVAVRMLVKKYNDANYDDEKYRMDLLHQIFPASKTNFYLEPPIYTEYGFRCFFGEGVYFNTRALLMDICPVKIGARSVFGPRASFYDVNHPMDHRMRADGWEYGMPITIGEDCVVGGSVTFTPGVTVGDRVIIGSGSVVGKDLPSDCVAVGNPCRVVRKITNEEERKAAIAEFP